MSIIKISQISEFFTKKSIYLGIGDKALLTRRKYG
jgi:hypothetical protein